MGGIIPSKPEPIFIHNRLALSHASRDAALTQLAQKKIVRNPDGLQLRPQLTFPISNSC